MVVMAKAQEAVTCLVIYGTDDTKTTYALPDKPVLTYDGAMLLVTANEVEAVHALADIAKMNFEDIELENAIEQTSADRNTLIRATRDGVQLYGFASGDAVQLFGTDGRLLRSARIGSDGTLSLPLGHLPTGVYIVKVKNEKLKIKISK